jgi:nucleotide-binding universal stress UspA family protein
MSGPILIAYDGSEHAQRAVRRAGELLPGRSALVVSVWKSLTEVLMHRDVESLHGHVRDAAAELDSGDRMDAERMTEDGAALAREAGLEAEALVVTGKPSAWETLLEVADEHRAPLVVVGSRGLSGVRSALLGSVSMGLLNHATRPVMVVPPAAEDVSRGRDGPVLVAYDGSQPAKHAAKVAGELLAGRRAAVVSIWSSLTDAALGGVVGAPVAYVPTAVVGQVDAETRLTAKRTAEEGAALVGDSAEARDERRRDSVWSTLCELAAELRSPAIAIGARGHSAVEAALLGSVSHGVVHHSRAPVLVVPPELR